MSTNSAGHGTGHFIGERMTAILLLALMPLIAISAAVSLDGSFESARRWLASPFNAIAVILFLLISLYHMRLGIQVIVEDYIAKDGARRLLLGVNTLLTLLVAAVGVFALYKITLGG